MQVFKFLRSNMSAPTGTGRYVIGKWRSVRGELEPCRKGLHFATADLLLPFLSDTLWRAEIGDEYVWHGERGDDRKIVARKGRVVERVEAWNDQTLRLFAADCAERVLHHFEDRYPNDKRPREAIEVARRFAHGEATITELNAAAAAAYAAGAAYANAAYAYAAGAAYAAAGANAAAYAGANAAAYAAAAYAAARQSERDWQNRHLAEMLGLTVDAEAAS